MNGPWARRATGGEGLFLFPECPSFCWGVRAVRARYAGGSTSRKSWSVLQRGMVRMWACSGFDGVSVT
jgi:hypothetical protein